MDLILVWFILFLLWLKILLTSAAGPANDSKTGKKTSPVKSPTTTSATNT